MLIRSLEPLSVDILRSLGPWEMVGMADAVGCAFCLLALGKTDRGLTSMQGWSWYGIDDGEMEGGSTHGEVAGCLSVAFLRCNYLD